MSEDRIPNAARVLAITGIPGSGKSTLAGRLAKRTGRVLLTSHDLVDLIDPGAIAEGRMADKEKMAGAFAQMMAEYREERVVLDGWPRSPDQAVLLPADTLVFLLDCSISIARERLTRRARTDDTTETIEHRLHEQASILRVTSRGGWARELATWYRTLNTGNKSANEVEAGVMAYLHGEKREVF